MTEKVFLVVVQLQFVALRPEAARGLVCTERLSLAQRNNPARGDACAVVVKLKKCKHDARLRDTVSEARSAGTSSMSSSEQDKVDRLIALCEKETPLSASDVAAVQQLLAAGAGVANGIGTSE